MGAFGICRMWGRLVFVGSLSMKSKGVIVDTSVRLSVLFMRCGSFPGDKGIIHLTDLRFMIAWLFCVHRLHVTEGCKGQKGFMFITLLSISTARLGKNAKFPWNMVKTLVKM